MKKMIFGLLAAIFSVASYSQDSVTVYQGANAQKFLLSEIDSITHGCNNSVNIYQNFQKYGYSVMKVDSVSFVGDPQTSKMGTAAIIMNASDPEIVQITIGDGSVIHFYGIKEENGLADSITHAEFISPDGEMYTIEFDTNGKISSFTNPDNVEITFDWLNANEAAVKIYNPEDNTYIVTNLNLNLNLPSARQLRERNNIARTGDIVMFQIPFVTVPHNAPEFTDASRNFDVRIRKCDTPTNAKVFLRLFEGETDTNKLISTIYDYQYVTQGWYSFKIPNFAFSTSMPNKEALERIDNVLMPLMSAISWFGKARGTQNLVTLLTIFNPELLPLLTPPVRSVLAGFDVFLDRVGGLIGDNGAGWFAKTFNPEWYYKKEYNSMLVIPYINGKPYKDDGSTIEYDYGDWGTGDWGTVVELDGEPEIRSFDLSPKYPYAGQGYTASAAYRCIPKGSKIVMSIVGTDGYNDEVTQTVAAESGVAYLHVPGAATGVHDVCAVTIYDPNGDPIASTQASLTFGQ